LASLGVPFGNKTRFLNIRMTGQVSGKSGRVFIAMDKLAFGQLVVPQVLVQPVFRSGLFLLERDAAIREALQTIESIRVDTQGIEVVATDPDAAAGGGLGASKRMVASLLARLGDKPEVVAAVRVYVVHLLSEAPRMPTEGDARFKAFVSEAFQLARRRSQNGNAALENRAAVLALGILLGHRHVEKFVGPVTNADLQSKAREVVGEVTLHHRRDWTRHFMVSAALAVLSADFISDAAGLLKEELDADGGSGFSFADLAADHAGTRFALAATRNDTAAQSMQEQLSKNFFVNELCPAVEDLPEGISDTKLQSEYGGVGGARYNQVLEEIERRLSECELIADR
jgi:hypothetical protein